MLIARNEVHYYIILQYIVSRVWVEQLAQDDTTHFFDVDAEEDRVEADFL
jgi:hypothetical protein